MPQDEIKNAVEHEELKASVKAIHIQIAANAEIQNIVLSNIENGVKDTFKQTLKTNGRVTILEGDMMIFRTMKKYKWLSAIVILGLLKVYEMVDLKYLFEKLLNVIL